MRVYGRTVEVASAFKHGGDGNCTALLTRVIEGEIIPRLMMAHMPSRHKTDIATDTNATFASPSTHVERLVNLTLSDIPEDSQSFVAGLYRSGVPTETILLDLIAPAARRLGEMWEDDEADFVDVTIALTRLHAILHSVDLGFDKRQLSDGTGHNILIAPVPGDDHNLGHLLVAEFFRKAGWAVKTAIPSDLEEVCKLAEARHYDVIGLSVGSSALVKHLPEQISTIRRRSKNRTTSIMLGGPFLCQHPGFATSVGADATAADAAQAVARATEIVQRASVAH